MASENKPSLLTEMRQSRGLSLDTVAEAVKTTGATLSRVERGIQTPKKKLANALFAYYEEKIPLAAIYDPTIPA